MFPGLVQPHALLAAALVALSALACGPASEAVGGLDAGLARAADAATDAKLDAQTGAKTDAATDTKTDTGAKTDVKNADTGPILPESCGNQTDDNGDSRIDEGCHPGPNLRADQQWLDLGLVQVGSNGAPTKVFNIPNKNTGVLLVARDIGPTPFDHYVWADTLISPNKLQILSSLDWEHSYNRAYPGIGGATALIGMSPLVSVVAGPWTFGFLRTDQQPSLYAGKTSPSWLHFGVLARGEVPGQQPVTLDLDVYLADGVPATAATFAVSPQWLQMRARVEQIWKPANLKLGTVHVYDITGDDGKKFHFIDNVLAGDASNELAQVYQATGKLNPKSTAATLVITAALTDNKAPIAAGLSQLGGVPGLAGSRMTGMAIVIDPEQWQQVVKLGPTSTTAGDVWGVVLAHELGHFLGLWHTDEADGKLHDLVDDTTPCAKSGKLTPEACQSQSKFLMFWSPKGSIVSPDQALVVRRSPSLRLN